MGQTAYLRIIVCGTQTVNLRNRFVVHRGLVRKKSDRLVHRHLKAPNHTFRDLTIANLEIPKSTKPELLDKLEKQWIIN